MRKLLIFLLLGLFLGTNYIFAENNAAFKPIVDSAFDSLVNKYSSLDDEKKLEIYQNLQKGLNNAINKQKKGNIIATYNGNTKTETKLDILVYFGELLTNEISRIQTQRNAFVVETNLSTKNQLVINTFFEEFKQKFKDLPKDFRKKEEIEYKVFEEDFNKYFLRIAQQLGSEYINIYNLLKNKELITEKLFQKIENYLNKIKKNKD